MITSQYSRAQSNNAVDSQSESVDENQPRYADDVEPMYGNERQLDLVDDAHIQHVDDICTLDSHGWWEKKRRRGKERGLAGQKEKRERWVGGGEGKE
ncbi:hypothetical protein CsatB_027988 [Cannabis sativa]